MTRYFYRPLLALAIPVAAVWMTLGIRNRPTNRLTESATQSRAPQLPASQPRSIWPEPRPLDLETLDGDEILFQKYHSAWYFEFRVVYLNILPHLLHRARRAEVIVIQI